MIQKMQSRGIEFMLSPGGELLFRGDLTDGDRETIRRNKERLVMELSKAGQPEPTPEAVRLALEIEQEVSEVMGGSDFAGWSSDCRRSWARSVLGIIEGDKLAIKSACLAILADVAARGR